MSRLDDLIQELCPNGVKFKYLGDISINKDSLRKPITSGKRVAGDYPYYGASGIVDYINEYIFDGDYLLVSEDGANLLSRNTPIAFSISGKNWVNNHAHVLEFNTETERKFIEYYLNSINLEPYISGSAQPKLNQKNLNIIRVPAPPLEIQKEIVRFLDDFTAKTAELQAELNKEYEARKKQYEYYRDQTLTKESLSTNICDKVDDVLQNIDLMCSNLNIELHNGVDSRVKQIELYKSAIENYFDTGKILSLQQEDMENVIMLIQHLFGYIKLTLNEACLSIKDGMHNLPKNTSEVGDYPIISAQNINNDKIDYFAKRYVDIDTYEKENKRTNVTQNDVLLTIVATIGRTALVKEDRPVLLQRSVCVLKPNSILRPSYLKYWLDTSNVQSYMQNNAHGSAQAGLYLKQVGAIEILIPSIEIQDKIVSALDNIRNISNNLQSKISSEIESRQKQYEYYRDKLLTFKELK